MLLTISGPPGTGKTATNRRLIESLKPYAQLVPSYTTRPARDSDIAGEYYNVTHDWFEDLVDDQELLWHLEVHGQRYGTRTIDLHHALMHGECLHLLSCKADVIPDIYAHARGAHAEEEIYSLFLEPPPIQDAWYDRLIERGETPASARSRINDALTWSNEAHLSTLPLHFVPNAPSMEDKYRYIIELLVKRFPKLPLQKIAV